MTVTSSSLVPVEDTAASIPILHVAFRVDRSEYALPASSVLQLESYTGATAVPGTPSHVAGIIQLRGRVVPVVDLRAFFGLEPVAMTLETRVVVAEFEGRFVALVADSAREVVRFPASAERPPPRLVDGSAGGVVRAVVQLGDRTLFVLSLDRLLGEETARAER